MRTIVLSFCVAALLSVSTSAEASRPIPVHHTESAYTGATYWASSAYTRGYLVDVERDVTLRGIEIFADFAASESCTARVYDSGGTLRAEGAAIAGTGAGDGSNEGWFTLPINTEVFAGETVTLAVYCTATTTTAYTRHRAAPTAQLDATGYFTNIRSMSFFGDGFPNGTNTWWTDWRIVAEKHGLHGEYHTGTTSGSMSNARGAQFTTVRPMSISAIDVYLDLDAGETCKAQVHDEGGVLLATGSTLSGDSSGYRWYRSDLAVTLQDATTYTASVYCAQATGYGRNWNTNGTYTLAGDATSVGGRSGGGDGVMPASSNAITPIMQFHEGEIECTNRTGSGSVSGPGGWSEWTWGWRFTPQQDIVLHGLEALMVRDSGAAVARVYDTASGALIGSSAISMPTSATMEWRLAPLPDIALAAGTEYTVAIYYSGGAIDSAYFYTGTAGSYTRSNVLENVSFCGSNAATDIMPTNCNFSHRVERLLFSYNECGDGVVGPGEDCDGDGMGTGGETVGCNADCTTAMCGDGKVNATASETCDGDGAGTGGETVTCDSDCTVANCGDGIINMTAGEACDGDGMGTGGETTMCDSDCTPATCGDGDINMTAGESCDGDGAGTGGETATCDSDCSPVTCGDGIVNMTAGEACDGDGMGTGGETTLCDSDCTASECGDGIVNNVAGETCDGDGMGTGGETAMCDSNCTAVTCGDGMVNASAGEMCDGDGAGTGGETATCDTDCTTPMCGDAVVNTLAGEACDDGANSAACNSDCTTASCGDGFVNDAAGETCDDSGETATCNADCTTASCGDGVVNTTAGETCDDAGASAACNVDCTAASCGDGVVNAAAGETCDDSGETASCNTDCSAASCGDGVVNATAGETCDDGNTTAGDGCASDCVEEEGSGSVGGCGCNSGGTDPWSSAFLFGLIGLLALRRRRQLVSE